MYYGIIFSRENIFAGDVTVRNDDANYNPHIILHSLIDNSERFKFT